jgi:hypothetical protein
MLRHAAAGIRLHAADADIMAIEGRGRESPAVNAYMD